MLIIFIRKNNILFLQNIFDNDRERAPVSRLRKKMSAMERQALKSKLGGLPPMPPPGVG